MGDERLRLASETVGALPVVNRFLSRLRVDEMFFRHLPPSASPPTPKDCLLLLLLRNLVLGRAPIYGLAEWAAPFRLEFQLNLMRSMKPVSSSLVLPSEK